MEETTSSNRYGGKQCMEETTSSNRCGGKQCMEKTTRTDMYRGKQCMEQNQKLQQLWRKSQALTTIEENRHYSFHV